MTTSYKAKRPELGGKPVARITLTEREILDLALFAGFAIKNKPSAIDDLNTEITVEDCHAGGVSGDDGTVHHYKYVAYFEDYPEEGVFPLGEAIVPVTGGKKKARAK